MTRKGEHHSNASREKMRLAHTGYKYSKEAKNSMSESQKGHVGYWNGKKFSDEHLKKLSEAQRGERSHCWKGGVTYDLYPNDWRESLKKSIRERDKYICQECGVHQDELDFKLDVHHIDYDKNNLDPSNLISLCKKCHTKTNYNRDYWLNYFKDFKRDDYND